MGNRGGLLYVIKNKKEWGRRSSLHSSRIGSTREQRSSSQSPRQLLRLSKEKPLRRTRQAVFFASFALPLLRIRAYSRKASERNPSKNPSPSVTASRLFLLRMKDSRSSLSSTMFNPSPYERLKKLARALQRLINSYLYN